MEYYSAMKRTGIAAFAVMWRNLESVIQSEVSQKEKSKYCLLMHIYGSRNTVLVNLFAEQEHRHRE